MVVTGSSARARELFAQRVVVLDGAFRTMLQGRGGGEDDCQGGDLLSDHRRDVFGDPNVLNLTRLDVTLSIHDAYLEAGADITTTDTFTVTFPNLIATEPGVSPKGRPPRGAAAEGISRRG